MICKIYVYLDVTVHKPAQCWTASWNAKLVPETSF